MHHMDMVRKDLTSKYLASSRYFLNRERVTEITRDVKSAVDTGILEFNGLHLGDSDNPKEPVKLIRCENEFGIKF